MPSLPEQDFATELRTQTSQSHRLSSAATNLTAPLALSSPKIYRELLSSFHHIYAALEAELHVRRHRHPKIRPIYFPQLLRTQAFQQDLSHYFRDDPLPPPTKATQEYVNEMRDVVERDPIALIAYAQCLYMGLFFGGAIVKGWVARAFGIVKGDGVRIFEFDQVSDRDRFVVRYRETLNSIALTREEKDLVIDRKKRVFQCNDAIFQELRQGRAYRNRVAVMLARFAVGVVLLLLVAWLGPRFTLQAVFNVVAAARFLV